MSIIIECPGGDRTRVEVVYSRYDGCVTLIFRIGPSYYPIDIPIKELALAIKQVEEEKDALTEKSRPDREESGIRHHDYMLGDFICRAKAYITGVLGDPRYEHLRGEIYSATCRYFDAARSPEEVRLIIKRFEKEYLRPDRISEWR